MKFKLKTSWDEYHKTVSWGLYKYNGLFSGWKLIDRKYHRTDESKEITREEATEWAHKIIEAESTEIIF